MTLGDIARELYGLPPAEFTRARDGHAALLRKDGDRELSRTVAALRRPTTAAWAVNLLVRARGDELDQLVALGAALREAQEALDGQELRELNRARHRLVAALRAQAEALAAESGQRLSEPVGRQVEATLHAAMADDDAATAVRTGLLTRELESTGLEPVETDGAVAVPGEQPLVGNGSRPRPRDTAKPRTPSTRDATRAEQHRAELRREAQRRADAVTAAEAENERAQKALAAAQAEADDAERRTAEAVARREAHARQLEELRAAVREAEGEGRSLTHDLDASREAGRAAALRLTEAERAAERARVAADALKTR